MLPFEIAVIVLALLLFFPVSQFIWVLSVRRLERKLGKALSEQERLGQRNRARVIAVFVSLVFSLLFNTHLMKVMESAGGG
ncbi:MAG TPA: hypothetical protein VLS27_06585 [Gammaproteobacteria bacterium]|nr:hypothetical protein [Gammaproteobacteria bacterium]